MSTENQEIIIMMGIIFSIISFLTLFTIGLLPLVRVVSWRLTNMIERKLDGRK